MINLLSSVFKTATREDRWNHHQIPPSHEDRLAAHRARKAAERAELVRHLQRFGR